MEKRVILSIKDLVVKFQVRGRTLKAIRNISLDIYDGETIAIVGESGSGKSVLTKALTSMLESNGYIPNGVINYYPSKRSQEDSSTAIKENVDLVRFHHDALDSETIKRIVKNNKKEIKNLEKQLVEISQNKHSDIDNKKTLEDVRDDALREIADAKEELKSEFGPHESKRLVKKINSYVNNKLEKAEEKIKYYIDPNYQDSIEKQINLLKQENMQFKWVGFKSRKVIDEGIRLLDQYYTNNNQTNKQQVKEYFETNLVPLKYRTITQNALYQAMSEIVNNNDFVLTSDELDFIKEGWKSEKNPHFIAKLTSSKNLRKLRGGTIATIFQDPMTSLNPLLSVGYQIIQAIRENSHISHGDAKQEAIDLLRKVGIPDPEKRIKDLPGKYSGGMRQRVVIAIALACKPKILIADEPTTALDVTIQAQILDLIKELKKEYGFTVIFITHDLGVVANIADRIAVVYAGQIIELGTTREIFFEPAHPYTWALLSSLPQLGTKGEELFSLEGSPPSMFSDIKGDAFAPRNKYALKVDYLYEPPMYQISDTHFAKTWLLDDRAPKVDPPVELSRLKEAIREMKVGD